MAADGLLRPVDDQARRLAKTLVRTARYGALASLEPTTGVPLASRIAVAPDRDGAPVALISRLSAHFAALAANPACSMLLGEPGKGDPLAHPRITVIGNAAMIDGKTGNEGLRHRFLGRHPKAALYVDFADFAFWRLDVRRAMLNAGFGKAYHMVAGDLLADAGRASAIDHHAADAVDHMNRDHAKTVELFATGLLNQPAGAWRLAGVDPDGMDLVLGDAVVRYWFDKPVSTGPHLRDLLVELARKARNTGP